MAKLIYKDGCEGLNSLSYIDGIEIELRKDQKALIYPKYRSVQVMSKEGKALPISSFNFAILGNPKSIVAPEPHITKGGSLR